MSALAQSRDLSAGPAWSTATLVGLLAVTTLAAAPVDVRAQALDFDVYRSQIEPIFYAPRGGHGPSVSPCVTCHVQSGTPMRLQPLQEASDGSVFWTEAQSRQNFEYVSRLVVPGDPDRSRLLLKALAMGSGGARFHVGGKFLENRSHPQWEAMASWVSAAAPVPEEPPQTLDFEFFRTCVQQIFQSKREGRMECVHCHGGGGRGFAQSLPEGRDYWNLEESQENFEIIQRYVEPGWPMSSRFLTHPLTPEAGGDGYHSGGRRWMSQDDPEWQMLAAWVGGEGPSCQVG
jgi:mono/diheme cytochrome c family protein